MAGILFTNDKLVLAGYSQHKKQITGIGGKQKDNELPYQTAIRETLEELFEFVEIPEDLINEISASIVLVNIIGSKSYSVFILSFFDLQNIIDIVNKYSNLESNVYRKIPKNISDLLLNRQSYKDAELKHLVLIPVCEYIEIEKYFMNDIKVFKNMISYNSSNVF